MNSIQAFSLVAATGTLVFICIMLFKNMIKLDAKVRAYAYKAKVTQKEIDHTTHHHVQPGTWASGAFELGGSGGSGGVTGVSYAFDGSDMNLAAYEGQPITISNNCSIYCGETRVAEPELMEVSTIGGGTKRIVVSNHGYLDAVDPDYISAYAPQYKEETIGNFTCRSIW